MVSQAGALSPSRNLQKVVCGKGMEKIHAWAFGGCEKMTEAGLICGPDVDVSPQAFEAKVLNT